jgi:hypothetical protein
MLARSDILASVLVQCEVVKREARAYPSQVVVWSLEDWLSRGAVQSAVNVRKQRHRVEKVVDEFLTVDAA